MKEQTQNCILKRRWGKDRCKSFFSRVGKWSELVAKYAACRGYGWNGICRLQYRSVRAYLISSILRWLEFEFEASNWFRVELWLPFVGLCPPSFIIFSFFFIFLYGSTFKGSGRICCSGSSSQVSQLSFQEISYNWNWNLMIQSYHVVTNDRGC